MRIDINGLKEALSQDTKEWNTKAAQARRIAEYMGNLDLSFAGLDGEAYRAINQRIKKHAAYVQSQALFMQALSSGCAQNLKAAEQLEPSEQDGSVDTGRLNSARFYAIQEKNKWEERSHNHFFTEVLGGSIGSAWENMCESIVQSKQHEINEYERKLHLVEEYIHKSESFYTLANSLEPTLIAMAKSQKAAVHNSYASMTWVNDLMKVSAEATKMLLADYLHGKELKAYQDAVKDGKITVNELYDAATHKPNLVLFRALGRIPAPLLSQQIIIATADSFNKIGTDPNASAAQRAKNMQAVLASQMHESGRGTSGYAKSQKIWSSDGKEATVLQKRNWDWTKYMPSPFMAQVNDYMDNRNRLAVNADGRPIRLDEYTTDAVWMQCFQLVSHGIKVNAGNKLKFTVEIFGQKSSNNQYSQNNARAVLATVNGLDDKKASRVLREMQWSSHDFPEVYSSGMHLTGNPKCYTLASNIAHPDHKKPVFEDVLVGEIEKDTIDHLYDDAFSFTGVPEIVSITFKELRNFISAFDEYEKQLKEYNGQTAANKYTSLANLVDKYDMFKDAHLSIRTKGKSNMTHKIVLRWGMDPTLLSHYLKQYNQANQSDYNAQWFLDQLNSPGLVVKKGINNDLKHILAWGQQPARVRNTRTGKVSLAWTHWEFLKLEYQHDSSVDAWELVK